MFMGIKLALLSLTNMTTVSGSGHKMWFLRDCFLLCFRYPKKPWSAELQPGKRAHVVQQVCHRRHQAFRPVF